MSQINNYVILATIFKMEIRSHMEENKELVKYLVAQNQVYLKALEEIKNGKKESHYMWFIFPQLRGLGLSDTAKYYAIANLEEAADT